MIPIMHWWKNRFYQKKSILQHCVFQKYSRISSLKNYDMQQTVTNKNCIENYCTGVTELTRLLKKEPAELLEVITDGSKSSLSSSFWWLLLFLVLSLALSESLL